MTVEFRLPELGENITSGTASKVLVQAGDEIEVDQSVLEMETDKAVVEIPSNVSGRVAEVRAKVGQTIEVGEVILVVEEGQGGKKAPAKEAPSKAAAPPKDEAKEEPKAQEAKAQAEPQGPPEKEMPPLVKRTAEGPVLAAPSARRLARELGVDITEVPGSGSGGRVYVEDIVRFAQQMGKVKAQMKPPSEAKPSEEDKGAETGSADGQPEEDKWGAVVRKPMNAIRKKTAERMTASWQTIPHVTHFDTADITQLEAFRKQYKGQVEKAGGKLTVTAVLVKLVAEGLRRFPQFNASVNMGAQEVVEKKYYHIGVAADTENGLLVPVVRNVDQKSIQDLTIEIPGLAKRARDRKLGLDEMQGGTFTMTNLGGIGGVGFTPIINAPEVAILGVSRSRMEPVYEGGQFVPRLMMPLALSYDHRVIDGADAARFVRWLADALEQPWALMLEVKELGR